jgi:glycosyltransferase involved in cell wall biosynthesis/SAM-dependent methyltransferase
MQREETIRRYFDRSMRLLELGPSYSPIVPKSDGWQTTIIDHADRPALVAKYGAMGVTTLDRIEPVDFVWQDGPLTALIPEHLHYTFDGLVSSHVGEHVPDLIGFFQTASRLVKPGGLMALALPDKRVCFDFFQPMTTTGDLIEANRQGRTRHQRKTFFNQAAYFTTRDGNGGWAHTGYTAPFQLAHPLSAAQSAFDDADDSPASPYRDTHAWAFTPKSFELLVLELNLLGHIDWAVRSIEPAAGVEFYIWLEQKRIVMPEPDAAARRLALLSDMVREMQDAIDQLDAAAAASAPPPAPVAVHPPVPAIGRCAPGITAIIPLYNGARFIEQTLISVFNQTVPPREIVVIDDGSTDGGAGVAIVENLARTRAVTLLRQPNGGQSSARNLGVRHSKTELIAFLDQDDLWYENHLEELVKPFLSPASPPLGWVYSNLDEIDENGYMISRSYLSSIAVANPKRHIFDCIRQDMFVLPSASLVSRKAFDAVGGFDERLCGYEDDDLFMRIFRTGYDNVFLDQPLSQWRIFPGSTSYTYRMAISRAIYARKLLDMFPDDVKRVRYYARDLIVPRFFDHAMREYQAAVEAGNPDRIAERWADVTLLAGHDATLAPRLFEHALGHYKGALLQGDAAGIDAAWSEVSRVAAHIPGGRKVRTTLNMLRNPAISRSMFALRRVARPAMRWAFSA